MRYKIKNRTISIPDKEIESLMKNHELTKDEAVKLWLEDEGYLENSEVETLTKNAKENKVKHGASATIKKERKPKERKADPTKENLIALLAKCLQDNNAKNVEIINVGKLITFKVGEDNFKLDLIRTKGKK